MAGKSPVLEREFLKNSRAGMAPAAILIITICYTTGEEANVKVKNITPFKSLFKAIERNKGVSPGTYRFHYDGARLQPDDTPADVGMEEGDMIDCLIEQQGG